MAADTVVVTEVMAAVATAATEEVMEVIADHAVGTHTTRTPMIMATEALATSMAAHPAPVQHSDPHQWTTIQSPIAHNKQIHHQVKHEILTQKTKKTKLPTRLATIRRKTFRKRRDNRRVGVFILN